MSARWLLALALGTIIYLSALVAASEPVEQARENERVAREAFAAEDYRRAAQHFAKANDLVPSARTKYNEAQSWYRAGNRGAAADAYEIALQMGTLERELSDKSRRRLELLRRELGLLVILSPEGARVSVEHAQLRPVPTRIHLAAGKHMVTALTPARRRHELPVELQAGATVQLALPPDPLPATPPEPVAATAPSAPAGTSREGKGQRIAGWIALGLSGAAGAAAIVLGARTLALINEFKETGNRDAALRESAVRLRTWTNVAAIGAAVAGGLGVALLLTAPDDPTAAALGAGIDGDGSSFGCRLRMSW